MPVRVVYGPAGRQGRPGWVRALPGGVRCWLQWLGRAFYAVPVETLTFLFTDIEGSTVLLRRLGEDVYAQVLADHHSLIRSGLAAHEGAEVGTQGDAFFTVFSSPKACVTAVAEMQRIWRHTDSPRGSMSGCGWVCIPARQRRPLPVWSGLDVHRAARVAAVVYGGQVLLSETAAAMVRDSLPPGAALSDLGVHHLKDLGRPEQIFQWTWRACRRSSRRCARWAIRRWPTICRPSWRRPSAATGNCPTCGAWSYPLVWSP